LKKLTLNMFETLIQTYFMFQTYFLSILENFTEYNVENR